MVTLGSTGKVKITKVVGDTLLRGAPKMYPPGKFEPAADENHRHCDTFQRN